MNRILIVDDDHDIALAFGKGLENNGFKVNTFTDPTSALSEFRAGIYDLLLLDVKMPKMNGFELYGEMVKIDDKVKVCFITAYEVYYQALREVFPTLNIECFIRKPIEIAALVDKVREELNSR
ncbi:MAG TPA: response regulator [Nitrososphaeraceae archaeon]|jgi:DNA-binding NtrC family response regulator|nr:response regulator [Nitrososphaeraceae archaeon]